LTQQLKKAKELLKDQQQNNGKKEIDSEEQGGIYND
jgi:hypothetical protein